MGSENSSLAAIVLAGGQSRRMGQDKALIVVNGVPLLQGVCQVALACTPIVYVVTPRGATYQPILPANCQIISEPKQAEPPGPLVGFALGLAQAQADWVLLLACDLPGLQRKVLCRWAAMLPTEELKPGDALALLPRSNLGWDPLCGFYHQSCQPSLQNFIRQGGRSFQAWLRQMPVTELPCPPEMLFNCNTPADLNFLQN